ncbi:MAG: glycosyltransferase [Chthoniobacterales bacterium]|nr:glycosyltransferase [Chthoniobacterales bacterium]
MNKKRILHIIDHLGLGGAQALLVDLVTLIDPTQWQCEVAVMHGRGFFAEALEKEGITVHSLSPTLWPPRYVPAFVRLQRDFDLLHFHLPGSNNIAKPLAALVGEQPRLCHDHSSPHLHYRGFFSVMLEAMMHRFSSHTIAVSQEIKDFLVRYEALSSQEVTVMLNGINTQRFRPFSQEEEQEARAFFSLPKSGLIIGTAARLAPEKNQKLFLEAAAQAIQEGLLATFVIAGSGPEEKNLKALVNKLGISERVCFLGQIEERVLLYRAFDLFALTSDYEGLPVALLEAMASGIPVVSTDLKAIHDVLEGGLHGTLLPCHAKEKFAQAFLQCGSPLQKEKAMTARKKVETDFSSLNLALKVEALYWKLLS